MKIVETIKNGKLKGWTIRKSIWGWYDLYSKEGVSQTIGKNTREQIQEHINELEK